MTKKKDSGLHNVHKTVILKIEHCCYWVGKKHLYYQLADDTGVFYISLSYNYSVNRAT